MLASLAMGGAFAAEAQIAVTVAQSGGAFVVDVLADIPVSRQVAWEVLTDFDRMALFMASLKSSRVLRREGNLLHIRQEGVAQYGPLTLTFESEREIRLEPKKRILSKALSGAVKRLESEARILEGEVGTQIRYHAEIVPDSAVARMFGATVVRHEIEEQFRELVAEMLRRHGGSAR